MGLVDDFEKRLERVVEGVFSKAFRSDVEPAELGRRLLREMEAGKSVSVGAVYVPNDYTIRLAPEEFARFEGLIPTLQGEFSTLLKTNAGQRRWRLPGPIVVKFLEDTEMKQGKFDVDSLHLAADPSDASGIEPDVLVQIASGKSWRLDSDEVTLGRSSSNGIVVDDPNASRAHAQLSRRAGEWWLTDLDSTNGTLVNDMMIRERRLTSGDRIKIGATELEYRQAGSGIT